MDPCGRCPPCLQVLARTHPDLDIVAKPADKSFIPLELLIGDKEHRMQRGLCHNIGMKPFRGGRKVAVIDDADYLNAEGANSLLKTLEEPPPQSVLMLVGTSAARQLPTIRSRCQLIRFRPLEPEAVAELLVGRGLIEDAAEARRLAAHSGGSLQRAVELAEGALWAFRSRLHQLLAEPVPDSLRISAAVSAFVEEGGKEAAARRLRMRQAIGFASEFYEQLLRGLAGAPLADDRELRRSVEQALKNWGGQTETAAACLDRCIDTAEHVDRNANPTTLLECWLDDLRRITVSGWRVPGALRV
jgi:DNA polymerase-3 subunit delta'